MQSCLLPQNQGAGITWQTPLWWFPHYYYLRRSFQVDMWQLWPHGGEMFSQCNSKFLRQRLWSAQLEPEVHSWFNSPRQQQGIISSSMVGGSPLFGWERVEKIKGIILGWAVAPVFTNLSKVANNRSSAFCEGSGWKDRVGHKWKQGRAVPEKWGTSPGSVANQASELGLQLFNCSAVPDTLWPHGL